ncbi:MAG: hypothetical protein K9H49_09465 [Bacteroidales bacterium]|nr:hypothetical protein [Bacteroidales bacterium]MCF8390132.1 hypothetical protein [Bacteroidales bacterium]
MKRIANRSLIKIIMLLVMTFFLGFWSCEPVYELPVEPSLEANKEYLGFGLNGGEQNIKFTANRDWTAKLLDNQLNDSLEWCSISVEAGKAGNNSITISVQSLEGDYREATLLLNCSGAGAVIPIMQSGFPVVSSIEATNINEFGATLTGNWFYSDEIEISEIGFAIAIESTGEYTNTMLEVDSVYQGSFSTTFSNLMSDTNYLFKFYVKTSSGEYYYSDPKAFKTDVAPLLLAVKDLVTRAKELSVGGSQEQTQSEFIEVSISNLFETDDQITLSLVDVKCNADAVSGSVANYGITATLAADTSLLGIYHIGDVLKIRTKGTLLSNIDGNPIMSIKDVNTIQTTSTGFILNPVSVDHAELNNYLAMYIAIENTQVTKPYLDVITYSSWSSTIFTMEVSGSETSYLMQVPVGAAFSADPVLTGSGTMKGIVSPGQVGYLVNPRAASDLADLTKDRFTSSLELSFLDPELKGNLTQNEASTAYISIPYINGDGTTIKAEIYVEMSGPAFDSSLSVSTIIDPTVGIGIGQIKLSITGTPKTEGEITFTIKGFDAYISNTILTAIVVKKDVPVVGNFEVIWDVSTCNYATSMPFTTNTNPSITVSELVGVNFNGSPETTKYTQDFATTGCDVNTDANRISSPELYLITTLKVASGKILQLSGLDITCRTNGGDSEVSFQYSLDGTNFIEIDYFIIGSIVPTTINLGGIEALKNVVEGSTVTFRIVPVNPVSTAKWGVSGKSTSRGLAIYGEVIDK